MEKIAITAASGQLGSEIAKATIKAAGSTNTVALARTPKNAEALGVEVRPGDYNDPSQLSQSLRGIDTLLLVSGMAPPEKRIGQHRNVINAAKNAGVKKIVYTSIQGSEESTAFAPIVQSNRQTEEDVRNSGLEWVIGRNGIYIEPDIEYLDEYKKLGEISNCAADGKCGYTTRTELGTAYASMLTQPQHNGQTYNLHGEALTQQQLVTFLNATFSTNLTYRSMTVADYLENRKADLGEFIGTVIAGIYEGIRIGAVDNESHYTQAAGRKHQTWQSYFNGLTQ